MNPEVEVKIIDILNKISKHYNLNYVFENLDDKQKFVDELEIVDVDLCKLLKDHLILFESYKFIKSDRTLMFKARDIWKIELDHFVASLKSSEEEICAYFNEKGIE